MKQFDGKLYFVNNAILLEFNGIYRNYNPMHYVIKYKFKYLLCITHIHCNETYMNELNKIIGL